MPEEAKPKVTTKQDAKADAALSGLKSVTVRAKTILPGAAYWDPIQKVTIRGEFVTVKRTSFVNQKLAGGELEER